MNVFQNSVGDQTSLAALDEVIRFACPGVLRSSVLQLEGVEQEYKTIVGSCSVQLAAL